MAGSSNFTPVSGSSNPFFLETLLSDNQSNLLADLSNNMPFTYTSLLSQNPTEMNVPPSTTMIHIPAPPPRIQDSIPTVTNRGVSEAGPSKRPVKRCRTMAELMESTNPSPPRNPASNLPKTSNPFSCGCCHVLREIIHTNGLHYKKLEVHGRIGMICHAVFHQDVQGGSSSSEVFDFTNKNMEEIKHFLEQHCLNQSASGYVLVPDPLSSYYEALCVGLEWTKNPNKTLSSSFPTNTKSISSKGKEPAVQNNLLIDSLTFKLGEEYRARAEHRERIQAMTLKDLSDVFHLTLEDASNKIGLTKSAVKGIYRRENLKKWPHKRLTFLMKKISTLREKLPNQNPISRTTIKNKIRKLQEDMVEACGGVVPTVALLT